MKDHIERFCKVYDILSFHATVTTANDKYSSVTNGTTELQEYWQISDCEVL